MARERDAAIGRSERAMTENAAMKFANLASRKKLERLEKLNCKLAECCRKGADAGRGLGGEEQGAEEGERRAHEEDCQPGQSDMGEQQRA